MRITKLLSFCYLIFILSFSNPIFAEQKAKEIDELNKNKKQDVDKNQGEKNKGHVPTLPEYIDEYAGIKFTKPSLDWQVVNTGPNLVQRILCVPPGEEVDSMSPRFAILIYPATAVVGGMEFRRQQTSTIANEMKVQLHQNKFEKSMLGGKEATMFSYDMDFSPVIRTVEYGVSYQGNFYVVQAAAPISNWENAEFSKLIEKSFNSVSFVKILNQQ